MKSSPVIALLVVWGAAVSVKVGSGVGSIQVGTASVAAQQRVLQEVSVARHLADGDEQKMTVEALISHGRHLFTWIWNARDGAGRPIVSGHGDATRAPRETLRPAPASMTRLSGADSTACALCHHEPFGIAGGGGTRIANVLAFGAPAPAAATPAAGTPASATPTAATSGGATSGGATSPIAAPAGAPAPAAARTIVNRRATVGIFGAGFLEMVARQITTDLQAIRDRLGPGRSAPLVSKGLSFGTLTRAKNGSWDTTAVTGLPAPSLATTGAGDPPNLLVRPFHQAGVAVSLRQFTSDAFQLHHGIQSAERVGTGADPDGDGFANELTRADVTAVAIFEATLAVPGRVIPSDPAVEESIRTGERLFEEVRCARCHVPALPLDRKGWIYSEPNPFNPAGNLRPDEGKPVTVDLTSDRLPPPRLTPVDDVVWVPAYTDLQLHDITTGPADPDREPLDQHATGDAVFEGNSRFVTKRLWGAASEPPFFHNGRYATLRDAVIAHAGEALAERTAFAALPARDQEAVIAFLNSLRVLPPGTRHLIVDERGQPKAWPSARPSAAPQPAARP